MGLSLPRRLHLAAAADAAAREWDFLTTLPEKAAYYSLDTYFRQAWSDVDATWGPSAPSRLHSFASILFRPDAVVGRRLRDCLVFLQDHNFLPVRLKPFRMTRHMALDLWRYQHNAGTLDRIAATEELVTAADSLYVLLWDAAPEGGLPATVRLRGLKGNGAGDPAGAAPTLRSTARIVNRIMAMLHTADEPMDLVRELGIYFDAATRRSLLRGDLPPVPFDGVISTLEARNPAVELDPIAALHRLLDSPARHHLSRVARGDGKLDWLTLSATLTDLRIDVDRWDRVLIASHYINYDESDDMLILGTGDPEWHARHSPTPLPAFPR